MVNFHIPVLTAMSHSSPASFTLHHGLNTTNIHVDFFDNGGKVVSGPFWTVYDPNTIQIDARHITCDLMIRIVA